MKLTWLLRRSATVALFAAAAFVALAALAAGSADAAVGTFPERRVAFCVLGKGEQPMV